MYLVGFYCEKTQILIIIKICQMGAELFHADGRRMDGQTDRHDGGNRRFSQS